MSRSAVQQVIQKAVGDAAFRRQLQQEPAKALAGFDLTAEERSSITSGDPSRLTALGVDQRMSKAFAVDASASVNAVSGSVIGDAGASSTAAFLDEGGSGSNAALIGDADSGSTSALIGDTATGPDSAMLGDDGSSTTSAIIPDTGTLVSPAEIDADLHGAPPQAME